MTKTRVQRVLSSVAVSVRLFLMQEAFKWSRHHTLSTNINIFNNYFTMTRITTVIDPIKIKFHQLLLEETVNTTIRRGQQQHKNQTVSEHFSFENNSLIKF